MIKRPNNWNEVKEATDRQKLPLGAYVCRVIKAAVQQTDFGEQLYILFDIAEGDFKGYFDNEYKNNIMTNRKWKGVLRQWLPKDDGSDKDEWTKSCLKSMTAAFEKSNAGYLWNWEESTLVGRTIGIVFRNEEWEYENKTGWTMKPFKVIDVNAVRAGKFTLPKDKPLKKSADIGYSSPANDYSNSSLQDQSFSTFDNDNDLPF